jgi:hypothetical protein
MNILLSCDKCGGLLALVEFEIGCPRCLLSLASGPELLFDGRGNMLDTGETAPAIGPHGATRLIIRNKTPKSLK